MKKTKLLYDTLWSDPAKSEKEMGYMPNLMRPIEGVVRYGADKVTQFLDANKLELMIRGHEIALDGFDNFAGGRVLTVTSCTNYCGKYNNSGCILVIQKTFEITPKLLLPPPDSGKLKIWIDSEEEFKRCPPTPPRPRSNA